MRARIFLSIGDGAPYMLRFANKEYLLLDCTVEGSFAECGSENMLPQSIDLEVLGDLISKGEVLAEEKNKAIENQLTIKE